MLQLSSKRFVNSEEIVMTDNVRNELDVIWSRIEPTLKKLLPQTSFEDRMRLRALVGR